jgi:hypothetical protein
MRRGWKSCGPLAAIGAIGLSGIILAVVTGCVYALVTEIDDLRLEGIDHVAVTEAAEVEPGHWQRQIDGPGELLQVKLSTRDSLTETIARRGLDHAAFDLFFCDEGMAGNKIVGHDDWVFAGDNRLQIVQRGDNALDVPRALDGRYVYSILVDQRAAIRRPEYVNGQPVDIGTVDIEKPIKPVCLQIYVPQMIFGKTIRTNIVPLQDWNDVMSIDPE